MSLSQIISYLAVLAPALEPELMSLEAQGYSSLEALVNAKVASPDLHALLVDLDAALDGFAKYEIAKL